jgi:hypothetical protein
LSLEAWALVASVVFAGLWSGLLLMLTTVLHPVMEPMDGRGFALFLRQFLPRARKAVSNYVAVLGMLFSSLVALVALAIGSGGTPLALTAIGFALVVAGPLLVSNRLAEPLYDVMLAWDPDAPPADWEATRARYFAINWIRSLSTWAAFGLFLTALVVLLA